MEIEVAIGIGTVITTTTETVTGAQEVDPVRIMVGTVLDQETVEVEMTLVVVGTLPVDMKMTGMVIDRLVAVVTVGVQAVIVTAIETTVVEVVAVPLLPGGETW